MHVDLSSATPPLIALEADDHKWDQGGEVEEKERTSASVPPSKYPNPGTSNVKVHDNFCSSVLPHASGVVAGIRDYLLG